MNHVNKLLYLIQRIYKNKIYLGLENYLNSLHKYVPKKEQIISLELNDVENFYQIIAEWLLTYQIESRNQINNELIRAYNDVIFNSNNLFLEANTNLFIFDKLLYYNFLLKLVLYPKRWINYTIDFIIFRELIEKKIQCNHPKMEQLLRVNKYIEPAILFKLVNYLHSMNLITKEELYKDFEKNHKASSFQKIIKIFRINFLYFKNLK
ncbi:MAG: hypothetical protein IPI90_06765 [Saprospiraceae bacterium]|nr:hypothetical protein [Candidatus Vicinibacter affinis]